MNSARRTLAHAMRSIASAVPSRPYSFVLIALLALSVASCRTARKAQSETQSQVRTELSLDSSASRKQASETLKAESLATMETWEQTWMVLPLDSSEGGGLIAKGKGARTLLAVARSKQSAIGTDSSNVVRTASERHSTESKTEARKSPNVMAILAIWMALVFLFIGIGYLLVKHQNK